jgi:putative addiction module CopG family antidote
MSVSLSNDLKTFVQDQVKCGHYPSEQAVIEAALTQLRNQDMQPKSALTLDDLIDHEFVEYCAREADDGVTLQEVLHATSTIKDSMARVIIEEERAERF